MTSFARLACSVVLVVCTIPAAQAASRGAAPADLIKAGKVVTVSEIDYQRKDCNDDRTMERWLKDAIGKTARSITWSGGVCKLANKDNPRDAATKWCASAVIVPKKGAPATTEINFDEPKDGKPGKPIAFRALVKTKAGWDSMRETRAFEENWGKVHIPDYKAPDDICD